MVFHYPTCRVCGKSTFPTNDAAFFEDGTGRMFICMNGHTTPVQESLNL